jgi:predicted PhzF superfamily epimerase YddE/YHI9
VAWAWADSARKVVRARAFLDDYGVPEDEATGAAALRLCAVLGRAVRIQQGVRSVLHARPAAAGRVELGGLVAPVERRRYRLS